ncbi:DMT family transporter [Arthrobacter crystallopoietes]|uniref:DMT family transporter n=1 Tax=Crystallibacter crystallopoietes TaxID=37928 RepID=UPI00094508D4|nr:SMR family transporter [Arthrobacter crystallopoietes]AUI51920.1 QacE family quaternary ammonium compound efflux SMR transporter [Arthrobacter crystallopoietes]
MATTPRKGALLLAGAIITEVAGSLSLKGALTTPLLYAVVVVGYVAAFVLLAAVLRTGMAIGVAYGIWGATGVALTAVMSLIIFGEPLTLLMGIGILVIIAGVLCVELGSQAAHRGPAEVNSEVA